MYMYEYFAFLKCFQLKNWRNTNVIIVIIIIIHFEFDLMMVWKKMW